MIKLRASKNRVFFTIQCDENNLSTCNSSKHSCMLTHTLFSLFFFLLYDKRNLSLFHPLKIFQETFLKRLKFLTYLNHIIFKPQTWHKKFEILKNLINFSQGRLTRNKTKNMIECDRSRRIKKQKALKTIFISIENLCDSHWDSRCGCMRRKNKRWLRRHIK